jgi:Lysozyme like domain
MSGKKSASKPAAAPSLRVPKDGARFTLEELRAFATDQGFPDPNLAAAIAYAESGGFAGAVGDQGKSLGLWQIHTPSHPQYDPQSLLDAHYNAGAARDISKGGADWSPWTTYRTGAYQRYLPPAIAAATPAPAQLEAPEPEPSSPAARESEPAPLEVEVLDQVEGLEEEANGIDPRVRISDAEPPRTARGRRARRA